MEVKLQFYKKCVVSILAWKYLVNHGNYTELKQEYVTTKINSRNLLSKHHSTTSRFTMQDVTTVDKRWKGVVCSIQTIEALI